MDQTRFGCVLTGWKDLDNSNIVDVMDCFLHEDKCVAVEEFVNGKRLCDVLQKNIPV